MLYLTEDMAHSETTAERHILNHKVVQCLTSSQPILLKKNLFSKGFTWPKLFQPLWYLKN